MKADPFAIRIALLCILSCIVCSVSASEKDSLILNRIWEYQRANQADFDSLVDNVYTKFRFNVEKRNAALWLIPSMYVLAKDPREYILEGYSKVKFKDAHHFDINSQVATGTIRKNRKAMPTLIDFMTPNIYDVALYDGHMLSPFNKYNSKYYSFKQTRLQNGMTRLDFRPKLYNTQLANGYAVVETETGRIMRTIINGEFDMITFRTEITQAEEKGYTLKPLRCNTAAIFRFMGNRTSVLFNAYYNCGTTLPDSITNQSDREMMDTLRPVPLNRIDRKIYQAFDEQHRQDSIAAAADTLPKKPNLWKKIFWDTIGDNLVTPLDAESDNAFVELSPIVNPLYISYSHRRGLRYKMHLRSRVTFSAHRYLTFNPSFGYNFKQKMFYFTAPLRMTYNPKRNGYAEITVGNGNRISNPTVMDAINAMHQDTIDFSNTDIDEFDDNHVRLFNNIMLFDWLDLETAIVMHNRRAVEQDLMRQYGMPRNYRSFSTIIGLTLSPWQNWGPVFSIDWERSYKDVLRSNISYERWEADAQWKYRIPGLRVLNLRAGGGAYSSKNQNFFVDFANFHDENLPEGWDDDWSGNFQLLRSREYNLSDYYLRGNISYESPMLLATWIPYFGKYIEKERYYISSVLLQHSRPYYELGYGFTNRYISVGAFASFRNAQFDSFGMKFDFELFKRW